MSHVGKTQRTARPGCRRRIHVIGCSESTIASKVLLVVLSLCVLPAPSQAEPRSFEALPVVYVVAEERGVFSRVMRRIRSGELEYNEALRKPTGDDRPVPVNCKRTQSLGVIYVLSSSRAPGRRPLRSSFTSDVRVRYVWEHTDLESQRTYIDHSHPVEFPRYKKTALGTVYLPMRRKLKVDGFLDLTASIDGEPILNVTFELTGCATPG